MSLWFVICEFILGKIRFDTIGSNLMIKLFLDELIVDHHQFNFILFCVCKFSLDFLMAH